MQGARSRGVDINLMYVRRSYNGGGKKGAGRAEGGDYWNEGDPADTHDSSCRFPAPAER